MCGGFTVSSGEGRLTGCVGGIDGVVLWTGIARSVPSSSVGLVGVVYLGNQGGVCVPGRWR